MNTPDNINDLRDYEVFVFGSNTLGHHFGGAAKIAYEKFGAVWGQGEGPQGQSYAIPTMDGLELIENAVRRFLAYARNMPGTKFYVTKIGCGIAGHPEATIKSFFAGAKSNVILPEGW